MARRTFKRKKTLDFLFGEKHKAYIRRSHDCTYNVAEGAVRAGKTTDNVFAFAHEMKTHPDKLFLATGSTAANAMLNIGDGDGHGLEHIFRGQCRWGKYKGNACLYVKGPATGNRQKIVIFAGGALANSFKKIRGNSYGMWIATEINLHHDNTIKEANNRLLASKNRKLFWDLNPDHPKAPIYTDYLDKWEKQTKAGEMISGYNYEHFTIFDNDTITEQRKKEIISDYDPKSIWYQRDILGKRCIAEGLIYPLYAAEFQRDTRKNFRSTEYVQDMARKGKLISITIGVDFGGNGSGHAFVATAITEGYSRLIVLSSRRYLDKEMDPFRLGILFVEFFEMIVKLYGFVTNIYCDNADTTLINGLQKSMNDAGHGNMDVGAARKREINSRITATVRLMVQNRIWYTEDTESFQEAVSTAVWDGNEKTKNVRLDDGTSDIDTLDAFEYSFEREIRDIIDMG